MYQDSHDSPKKISHFRKQLGIGILIIVGIAFYFVQSHMVEHFEVVSGSMEPTLLIGDRLIKTPADSYVIGDIVVFYPPDEPDALVVKRLVAKDSGTVELRNGYLLIDGVLYPEGQKRRITYIEEKNANWQLNEGDLFFVGDNIENSHDSRMYGPVRVEAARGVVRLRSGPAGRRGPIE